MRGASDVEVRAVPAAPISVRESMKNGGTWNSIGTLGVSAEKQITHDCCRLSVPSLGCGKHRVDSKNVMAPLAPSSLVKIFPVKAR